MTLVGTLKREFFGGPVWVLTADDGASYQLKGKVPDDLEGRRVRVSASKAEQGFGFSMVGEVLEVRSVTAETP
ncbi:MAG: hypothetical protein GY913_08975 [Proteobacteria bacterium]|nr:hypothetical protein [Pseudomonadota bacterium]MCP4917043.1 hypothetical protein [Pseudomonadota bacterium]